MVDILAFHSWKSTGVSNNTNIGFTALRQNKCDEFPFAAEYINGMQPSGFYKSN